MTIETEKPIKQIEMLGGYLSKTSKEELAQILEYGEEMKKRGEGKKKEFWSSHGRGDFAKLLNYWLKHREEIELEYQYLDKMSKIERKKFIDEFLHDDILYHGILDEEKIPIKEYYYEDWKDGKVVVKEGICLNLRLGKILYEGAEEIARKMKFKEGVELNLSQNKIGDEGAEAISGMELKEGVNLDLSGNQIGAEGAEAIAKNMKLEEGVTLKLRSNKIGAAGAKALAEKMELKEGVTLDLSYNEIGDEGAQAIAKNMKLKKGVKLNLFGNNISDKMEEKLKVWARSYNAEVILKFTV